MKGTNFSMPENENVSPTFEEAKKCPKCGSPGEDRQTIPAPPGASVGAKLHYIYCTRSLCPWYNTVCQVIQVNKDGSIPPPRNHTGEKKLYGGFSDHDQRAAELIETLKRNAQAETKPGGAEIDSRYQ